MLYTEAVIRQTIRQALKSSDQLRPVYTRFAALRNVNNKLRCAIKIHCALYKEAIESLNIISNSFTLYWVIMRAHTHTVQQSQSSELPNFNH